MSIALAVSVIRHAPEVKDYMRANNIGPLPPDHNRFSVPLDSRPISGDLDNVTVSEALDFLLRFYDGFCVYENCQNEDGSRTVYFRFFPRTALSLR